jgi:hypothetical protein
MVEPENKDITFLALKFSSLSPEVRQKILRRARDRVEPVSPVSSAMPIKFSKVVLVESIRERAEDTLRSAPFTLPLTYTRYQLQGEK